MKIKTIDELVNYKFKNYIKSITFTEKNEFNQQLLNTFSSFPNLKTLEFETNTIFHSLCNVLINNLCNSNINKIFIKFGNDSNLVWFKKDIEVYNYKNTKIKKCWNTLRIYDVNNNFNYNNLPNEINSLEINSQHKLELSNLPINLLKINIISQFVNPILGCQKWKIPFNCEIYYNDKLINIDI
jgi:hypothetical protein